MNDKTADELLRDAIQILETAGWHQGDFYHGNPRTGPVCAIGALNRAQFDEAEYAESCPEVDEACDRVSQAAGRITAFGITAWNDHPKTTAEDVILAFKRALASPEPP